MSNQDNGNIAKMQFDVNLTNLYDRMTDGKIGDHYSKMMGNEEIALYYAKEIIEFINEKVETITDKKLRSLFEKLTMPQNLFINFQRNIISIVLGKSLMQWINEGGIFEEIVISNIDVETIKEAIKMLQKAIKEIILDPTCLYQLENINNSSEEVVILHNAEKTSIDEYLKSIDPIRIMKFNNKTHMN